MSRLGPGTMMALIFAILIGVGGAYVIRQYMKPQPVEEQQPVQAAPQPIVVPTAARDLKPGRQITFNDIIPRTFKTREELMKDPVYGKGGKFTVTNGYMSTVNQIIGRMVKTEVKKGGTFLPDKFYADGTMPGVDQNLAAGTVARTLPITGGTDILQFVAPGSVVDVLFRTRPPQDLQTFTLLEGVKVLAVGQAVTEEQPRKADPREQSNPVNGPSVTVELSPYQAKWIAQVDGRGDLQVVLRNRDYQPPAKGSSDARLTMQQLVRMTVGEQKKEIAVYLGNRQQNVVFDRKPVYNDDQLIPIPVPRNPPANTPMKKDAM